MTTAPWHDYYEAQGSASRAPRELLVSALGGSPAPGDAVDLGCGQGFETEELLRRGWRVLAVDAEPEAIDRLTARIDGDDRDRLRTQVSPMVEVAIPSVDLVWASYSLFFNPPDAFDLVWEAIRRSIRPGGCFAGEILGERDTWATDEAMTALPRDEAERRLDGWSVERFEEEEEDGEVLSGPKHWHVFHVIARTPGASPEDPEG